MAKPETTFKLGSVRAAIFVNDSENGPFRTATIHRRYQDEQQQWHSSDSYGLQQLLQLRAVVDRTITELMDRQADAE